MRARSRAASRLPAAQHRARARRDARRTAPHAGATAALLAANADPNAKNAEGHTPLIEAVLQAQLGSARLLLAWGADPALTLVDEDDGPQTALDLARENDHAELVALLEGAATPAGLARLREEVRPAAAAEGKGAEGAAGAAAAPAPEGPAGTAPEAPASAASTAPPAAPAAPEPKAEAVPS